MTDKEAIAAITDFFNNVPETMIDRLELEQWARENIQEAGKIIARYAEEKQRQEEMRVRQRSRETELIMAEEYMTPEQKIRLVVALHPDGRSPDGQSNPYGVTAVDDYFAEVLIYHIESYEYDRDMAIAIIKGAMDMVRNDPNADPWLMRSVHEHDEFMRTMAEKWNRNDDHPSGR